jgi:molecular chaperone DnaK
MREPVVGIDLGTTNSSVATVEDGRPKVIMSRTGASLTPSMVGFLADGERVVGERARALSEHEPESVAFATKRFIGRRWTDQLAADATALVPYPLTQGPNGEIRIKVAGRVLPVTQISAMVLGELKLDAQAYFGAAASKAVITVPANFDDAQRQATKESATIAGFEVLRIVNEPTAAALAYGLDKGFQGRALVFDLGGGTFDVSILEIQQGVFEVKATGGDSRLGGEDFDNRIAQWLLAQLPDPFRELATKDKISLQRLKIASEKAKRELSVAEETTLSISDLGDHLSKRLTTLETALTRNFFETLSEPLSRRCVSVCERVMQDAKMEPKSVQAVLLVGGMTRVPLVRRLVTEFFGREPAPGVDQDLVVSLGAAIQADEIVSKSGSALLIDVASHSLGVGVLGGKVRRLVGKNTPIPVTAKETFLPGHAGQREARITIYQGESEYCDESTKLGEVTLRDLNVVERSQTPIDVSFDLATDGTLSVRATDTTTGFAEALRIRARTELSKSEVDKLAKEQGEYNKAQAQQDTAASFESFKRMLEKGEKLARLLQKSAEENPSADASAAVGAVKSLLDLGRSALEAKSTERIAEIGKRLSLLMGNRS